MTGSVVVKIISVAAFFSLALAGCAQSAACPVDYERQLDHQVSAIFSGVREGKSADVLKAVAAEGLTLNGQTYTQGQVRAQFNTRSGVYCHLFACGGRAAPLAKAFSFREAPQIQYDAANRVALVLSAPNTNEELMLTLRYSQARCAWEILDITTP